MFEDIPILNRIWELGYTMILVILISAIVGLILAFPVMWLWDFVFGELYRISVFQAWALNVLTGILFGKSGTAKK